ncbi:MAG: hypothetical protein AAGI38_17005 [Bacteroidota bacterium]
MNTRFLLLGLTIMLGLYGGCSTEVDINADPQDIYAVYGILDPGDSVQYIRISQAFLVEGDALEYAKENDQSVKELRISLEGNGKVYEATEVADVSKVPADGTFFPTQTVYRFDTKGDDALAGDTEYQLSIRGPQDGTLQLTATTVVPEAPRVVQPRLRACAGTAKTYSLLELRQATQVAFQKGTAVGFEVRAFLAYEANGVKDTVSIGPIGLLTEFAGCGSDSRGCYTFGRGDLLTTFRSKMEQLSEPYTYEAEPTCAQPEDLPKSIWFEVTATDEFFTNYLLANDPKFIDFNTVRPEYTNISGTAKVVGIFGSRATSREYAGLSECSKYLLGVNGVVTPPNTNCQL